MLRTGQSAAGEGDRPPAGTHPLLRLCMVQRPGRLLWRLDSRRGQVMRGPTLKAMHLQPTQMWLMKLGLRPPEF